MKQDIGVFISPEVRFSELSTVYWEAADSIFENIVSSHKKEAESLLEGLLSLKNSESILPALFLYRQSIELMIKEALELANKIEAIKIRKTHNLEFLFSDLLVFCKRHCDERVVFAFKECWDCIVVIHLADERGTRFRYLESKYGTYCVMRLKADYKRIRVTIDEIKSNLCAIIDHSDMI